ncbi:MAG: DUF748 domain-containing protein [Gammaproteobacteria bacterium]|nr:DUF748 domain-containing protein [Gammaproteobacteria bacterium]
MNSKTDKTGGKQRGRWLKILLTVALALSALYVIAVGWLVPRLGKAYLQDFVQQNLQRELRLQSIAINPFTLRSAINGVELREADGGLLLSLQSLAVEPNLRALTERRIEIEHVQLQAPWIHLRRDAAGELNLARLAQDATAATSTDGANEAAPAAAPPPFLLKRFTLANGALKVSDEGRGVANLLALKAELRDLSTLPRSEAAYSFDGELAGGGDIAASGRLALQPLTAEGRFSLDSLVLQQFWDFVNHALDLDPPRGELTLSGDFRFAQDSATPSLILDKLALQLAQLRLQRPGSMRPLLMLERLQLADAGFDLNSNLLEIPSLEIDGGSLSAERQGGRVDWQRIVKTGDVPAPTATPSKGADSGGAPSPSPAQSEAASGDGQWRVALQRLKLGRFVLDYADRDLARPLALRVGAAELALAADVSQTGGELNAALASVALGLDRLSLTRAGEQEPLLALEQLRLRDGHIDLSRQSAEFAMLHLSGGHSRVIRRQDGRLEWERVWQPAASSAAAKVEPAPSKAPDWRVKLAALDLSGFALALRDGGVEPAAALDLADLQLRLRDIDSRMQGPIGIELSTAIKQGGRLAARGSVNPAGPAAELDLDLQAISLLPARNYLKPFVRLQLDDGSFSTEGRLSYGSAGRDALGYSGSARIDKLLISEHASGEPLLGWQAMEAVGVDFGLNPNRLQIEELRLDAPQGKFVVNADFTTNWQQLLHPQPAAGSGPAEADSGTESAFPVAIGRVEVAGGKLDFSDLSLPLPFETKIHQLEGAIVGIASQPGARANSDLKGHVDEFGAATIKGEISPFDPLLFTDMGVAFSNLDVPSLTPYSAKFAGYKIDSGKLSLDLKYHIEGRQLKGDNQIVLEKLKLGEKVESPDAIDAPLELAIALMEDSRGVIDLGLPISGDLDDPDFSYGHLVFKAIGNLLTKIVTAPFKILGALLGVEGGDLDAIAFEPGSAELPPPQQEKLLAVARALAERPALQLTIQARYHEKLDAEALREVALRSEVNKRLGRKPKPGQAPDPVSLTDAKTGQVVEALFVERFSAGELAKLKQPVQQKPTSGAASAAKPAAVGADLHRQLYARLKRQQPLAKGALLALGRDRGERISAYLGGQGKLAGKRLQLQQPVAVEIAPGAVQTADKVESKLDLTAGN